MPHGSKYYTLGSAEDLCSVLSLQKTKLVYHHFHSFLITLLSLTRTLLQQEG